MAFNDQYLKNQNTTYSSATAVTAVVAGSTVGTAAGNVVQMQNVEVGTHLCAKVSMVVNTTSLTLTPKWQGSHDGTNWEDLFSGNGAANIATAAGTGSNVTTAKTLHLPVVPFRLVRLVFVTAGATAHATNDTFSVVYHWIQKGYALQ